MAREYIYSSRSLEKAFGRTGLGKLKKIKNIWSPAEADKKIKEVKDSSKQLLSIVKQLNGPHAPADRNRLIERLQDVATDYIQDVEELNKTHDETAKDIAQYQEELDTKDEHSEKGEIERLRLKSRKVAVTLGWGSMESKMKDMRKIMHANNEIKERLKGFVRTGGLQRISSIQERINDAAKEESQHAYSRYERISLEAAAESHDNRKTFHEEMSSHHSDLAGEFRKLGIAVGVVKEE